VHLSRPIYGRQATLPPHARRAGGTSTPYMAGRLHFHPGQKSAKITVKLFDDDEVEDDEVFQVRNGVGVDGGVWMEAFQEGCEGLID
jgi:hypothetical protein